MKKIYLLVISIILTTFLYAQDTLHFDGINNDAIGISGSSNDLEVGTHFVSSIVSPYIGYRLFQVNIYIRDLPTTDITLNISGSGSTQPGAIIHSQVVSLSSLTANSWKVITLSTPVILTSSDFWVSYSYTSSAYTAGCDAGPNNPEGQWIKYQGVWQLLTDLTSTLTFNWNIKAIIEPNVVYSNDVLVTAINSPSSGMNLGNAEDVVVVVKNLGTNPQTNVHVGYSVNGGSTYFDSVPVTLVQNESIVYTFPQQIDVSVPGIYNITACTYLSSDQNIANDCETKTVNSLGAGYIIRNGKDTTCNGVFFDTGGPTGMYQNLENYTYTIFPETAGNMIHMVFTAFNLESSFDYLYVYNGDSTNAPQIPGSPFSGITIPTALQSLSALNAKGALTFKFTSDGSVPRDGWAANITCVTPAQYDAGVTAITNPNTNYNLSSHDTVKITVFNYGVQSLVNLPVYYTVNGGSRVYDTIPGPISYGASAQFTFRQTVDLSNVSNYSIVSCTDLVADADITNDCKTKQVNNLGVLVYMTNNIDTSLCAGVFTDNGGPNSNYLNLSNDTMTLRSSTVGDMIKFTFSSFDLYIGDTLWVYNGENTTASPYPNSPFIYGSTLPSLLAFNPQGALTFVFKSDASTNYPGWSANIQCITPASTDALLYQIISPITTSLSYSSSELLTVRVYNNGTIPLIDIPISYVLNSTLTVSDTVIGTLNFGQYVDFTFTQPIDMSAPGAYNLNVCVDYTSDVNIANNCLINNYNNYGVIYPIINGTYTACSGKFTDSQGPALQYLNNENYTVTFYPETQNSILKFNFNSFDLESGYDYLWVYDGTDISAPLVVGSPFSGSAVPAALTNLIATNSLGAFTFKFTSDSSVPRAGWIADISCVTIDSNDVSSLLLNVSSVVQPVPTTPSGTVKNAGILTQSFNVTLTINPGGYSSTVNVSNLASLSTRNVTFTSWTPSAGTDYQLKMFTSLTNDANRNNDTILSTVSCSNSIWLRVANCPISSYMGTGTMLGNQLYCIGGNTTTSLNSEVARYDATTNVWSQLPELPAGRIVSASASLPGYVFNIGGNDGTNDVTTVYRYNISNNSWSNVAPLPTPLSWAKAFSYQDSLIYVVGGVVANAEINTVYLYNANNDNWRSASIMPLGIFGGGCCIVGDKIFYSLGVNMSYYNITTYIGSISQTNRSQITWSSGGTYPGHVAFKLDAAPWGTNKVIVAAGDTGTWQPTSECYIYNMLSNIWTVQPSKTYPTLGAYCGSTFDGTSWKYIVASGYNGTASTNITELFSDAMTLSNKNHILSFVLTQQFSPAVIDTVNHTVECIVVRGTSNLLVPSLTISPFATVVPANNTAHNFANPVIYTVTSQDGTPQAWIVRVTQDRTGIDENNALSVDIYPNPSRDKVFISMNNMVASDNYILYLYDISGKLMMETKLTKNKEVLDVEFLENGIYLIKIANNNGVMYHKIIKN